MAQPDDSTAAARVGARPSLVVDHVSVTYQVNSETRLGVHSVRRGGLTGRTKELVHAVKDVSLTVNEGESVGIVGRNGSGKSTLLRTMAGLMPPTSGTVMANSEPMLLGVSAALRPNLSGWRNIEIGLLALAVEPARLETLIGEVADFAGIGRAIYRPLSTYSSGMRARVHFAIATCIRPPILMIDEALGVGDTEFKAKSYARIHELREHAGTIVFVSHSAAEIKKVCDRAIWLDDGIIRAEGTNKEVLSAYASS